jgi:hypothetical protein
MKLSANYAGPNYRNGFNFWPGIQLSVGLLGLIVFALHRLPAGLWLDETLTAWVIRQDVYTTFNRSLYFQGQSPFYYLLVYGWTRFFGINELGLRSFSFCSFVTGCVFLYLIHRRKFSSELAICGTILGGTILLQHIPVLDARPDGLAAAFSIGSYYFFLVWLDTSAWQARALNVVCIVATIYTHWIYGTLVLVQTLLILSIKIPSRKLYIRQWIINLFIIGVLCSPNVYQLALIFQKRFLYNYLSSPNFITWAKVTFPIKAIAFYVLPILFLLFLVYRRKLTRTKHFFNSLTIGVLWIVIPTIFLFCASLLFDISVLSPRYNGASYAGFGLIIAALFSCLPRLVVRSVAMILTSIFIVFTLHATFMRTTPYYLASWREPTSFIWKLQQNNDRPILLSSGLIETLSWDWITDSSKREYLSAPLKYYVPDLNPLPLPFPTDLSLLEDVLVESNEIKNLHKKGFYLVQREIPILDGCGAKLSSEIFKRFFFDKGFLVSTEKEFAGINVFEFEPKKGLRENEAGGG